MSIREGSPFQHKRKASMWAREKDFYTSTRGGFPAQQERETSIRAGEEDFHKGSRIFPSPAQQLSITNPSLAFFGPVKRMTDVFDGVPLFSLAGGVGGSPEQRVVGRFKRSKNVCFLLLPYPSTSRADTVQANWRSCMGACQDLFRLNLEADLLHPEIA